MARKLTAEELLPETPGAGVLVGRIWIDAPEPGPRTCLVRDGELWDLSALAPTLSDLFDLPDPASQVQGHRGEALCSLEAAVRNQALLAPCDLQAVKATGVSFASSLIERVIEERARGDAQAATRLREEINAELGGMLSGLRPGTPEAAEARRVLMDKGLWSQYLEVGIGPDAEIFTKCQPLSAVGCGALLGVHPKSRWSNSEPEIVLAVSSTGRIVGASLGNDLNLRDFEGRSALLLGRAKDNNASCSIGPFVRLFDDAFSLDHVRTAEVHLAIDGRDGFHEEGTNLMREISRDPETLVTETMGPEHQYPDGVMLFLGTMFVPTTDRTVPGAGFTHLPGDIVRVSSPALGTLYNEITTSDQAPPWTFGARALWASLARRGLTPGSNRRSGK